MSEKDSAANQVVPAFVHTLGTLALAAVTAVAIKWFFSRETKEGKTLDDEADWHMHLDLMAKDEQCQKDPSSPLDPAPAIGPALLKVSKWVDEDGFASADDNLSLKDSSTLHDKCLSSVDSLCTVSATSEHDTSFHEDLPLVGPRHNKHDHFNAYQCPLVTLGSNGRLSLLQTNYEDAKMKDTTEQKMPFERNDKPESSLETVKPREKEEFIGEISEKSQGSTTQNTVTGLETDFSEGFMQYNSVNKSLYGDKIILISGKHENGKVCTTKSMEKYQSPVSNDKAKLLLLHYKVQHLGNLQANNRNILAGRKSIDHNSFFFAPRIERAIITNKDMPGNNLKLHNMCFLRPSINDTQKSQVKTVSPSSPLKTYPAIFCSTAKSLQTTLYPSLLLPAQAKHSWISKYEKYKHTEYKCPKPVVQTRQEKSNTTEDKVDAFATTSSLNSIPSSAFVSKETLSDNKNDDFVTVPQRQAFVPLCERDKKVPEIQKYVHSFQTQYLVHIPNSTHGMSESSQTHEYNHHGKENQLHCVITESISEEFITLNTTQVFDRLENNPQSDEAGLDIMDTWPIPDKDEFTLISDAKTIPSQSFSLEHKNSLSYEEGIAFNPINDINLNQDSEKSNSAKGINKHNYTVSGSNIGSTVPCFAKTSEFTKSSTDISFLNPNENSPECCRFQQHTSDSTSVDNTINLCLHGSQEQPSGVHNQWQQCQLQAKSNSQDSGSSALQKDTNEKTSTIDHTLNITSQQVHIDTNSNTNEAVTVGDSTLVYREPPCSLMDPTKSEHSNQSALQSTEFPFGTVTNKAYEETHEKTSTIDHILTNITSQQVHIDTNSNTNEAVTVGDSTVGHREPPCSLMDPSKSEHSNQSALQSTEFPFGTLTNNAYEEIHEKTSTIDHISTNITSQQVHIDTNSNTNEAVTLGDSTVGHREPPCSLMDPIKSEHSNHSVMDLSKEQSEPMHSALKTEMYPTCDLSIELEHKTQDDSQDLQNTSSSSSDQLLSSKSILSNIAESNSEQQSANTFDKDMPLVAKSCENIYSQFLRQRSTLKNKAQSMLCLLAEYYSSTGCPETGPVEEVSRGSFIRIPAGLQHVGKAMRVQLTLGNCLELLKLARKNSVPELLKAVYTVISDNYLHVLKNPAIYGRLTASERDQILELRMKGKASLCIIEMKSIFDWNKKKQDSAEMHELQSRGQFYALDMEKNQWKMVTSIPEEACLKGSSICSMHNYLFIAGGIQVVGGNSTCSNKLFCYNPLTDIWGQLTPMSQARSQLKLIPLDGHLYAIGGECLHTVEKYDPRLNKWTFTAPLPKGSFAVAHEAVACGGDIFISGGHLFYRLLKYSPVHDQWEECPFSASKGRSCDMIAVGNILYRFDIQRDSTVGIFKYNTISKSWSEYTAVFPGTKVPFRCAAVDGAIYCLNRETTTRFTVKDEAVVFESAVFSSFPAKGIGSACPVVLYLPESVPQTSV
ncbi:uncharacterized protein klhdc7b [Xenopus tropicalis]|uniref:Uncharacterized protein klhdc7b n=1 Tax=Xenopus tropicalis TaxID=8364 RepID=A0A8J1JXA7_XENTR|nr:uncharacterized protein klhdc7b [Xenopus tropicalis]